MGFLIRHNRDSRIGDTRIPCCVTGGQIPWFVIWDLIPARRNTIRHNSDQKRNGQLRRWERNEIIADAPELDRAVRTRHERLSTHQHWPMKPWRVVCCREWQGVDRPRAVLWAFVDADLRSEWECWYCYGYVEKWMGRSDEGRSREDIGRVRVTGPLLSACYVHLATLTSSRLIDQGTIEILYCKDVNKVDPD